MPPAEHKPIFISYASQDVEAARRICEALRASGLEVWFDQSELRGGDAWDAKIRGQIRECALFLPIVSANTEGRAEGYFRREWRLAVERMHDLADDEPFLLPIVVDDTRTALRVPERFRERQWTYLRNGEDEVTPFVARVTRLLSVKSPNSREAWAFESLVAPQPKPSSETRGTPPSIAPGPAGTGRPAPSPPAPGVDVASWLFGSRGGLSVLLIGVFVLNWLETTAETLIKPRFTWLQQLQFHIADAVHAIEGGLSFERHDVTNPVAIYGFSAAYFFAFPALVVATLLTLALVRGLSAFRVAVLAIVLTYAISLPCFLFFPVPERWAYPEAEAVLLSDLWTSSLIEVFRPFSGIDNCFPSFHVSLTTTIIVLGYWQRLRYRHATLFLGLAVVVSTFALGIHWLPDIAAGLSVGILAVCVAARCERRYFSAPAPRVSRDTPALDAQPPVPAVS